MQVGINYPWLDYGWDFGTPPPGWRSGSDPRWVGRIDSDIARFKRIGVSVVRWFILGDGLTYGTGANAPQLDPGTGQWNFSPPDHSKDFLNHFETLLQRLLANNSKSPPPVLLMPVFVDFHFCDPGLYAAEQLFSIDGPAASPDTGFIKQGRAQAINDSTKQADFLQRALQPLLQIAASSYRSTIYAWDIINEPEWVTNNWHPDGNKDHPIDEDSMKAFIEDGKSMIRSFDFKPTIGFNMIQTIRKTSINADINQFHFYSDPDPKRQSKLEKHPFSPQFPGIIGEFATSATQDYWPDLKSQPQSVLNRLKFIAGQNYGLALPWSFNPNNERDSRSHWDPQVDQEIECFVFGRNCPQK